MDKLGDDLESAAPMTLTLPAQTAVLYRTGLSVQLFDTLDACLTVWRDLEQRGSFTPYQKFDWLKALVDTGGQGSGTIVIAAISHDGKPVALLPLMITRRLGAVQARLLGSDIGNLDWLAIAPEAVSLFTPTALIDLLAEIGTLGGGIDLFSFYNLPKSWEGVGNPLLAFPHQVAPDNFYASELVDGAEPSGLSSKRVRNILRGRRRLEEAYGIVQLRRADTIEEIAKVQSVFIEQRGLRFAKMGVDNIFATKQFVDFFRVAAERSLTQERRTLCFHALYGGEEILATSCGTFCGTHYSQYINSTAEGPAAKYSLMGLLMYDLVQDLKTSGITGIDMGLGDFDYKIDWTQPQNVYDMIVGVTARGKATAAIMRGLRAIKRTVKQDERLWKLARAVRLKVKSLRGSP